MFQWSMEYYRILYHAFQVPKGRSAVIIAQAIRDRFFQGYRETEFLVVCDVKKENAQVIQELNDAQVNIDQIFWINRLYLQY